MCWDGEENTAASSFFHDSKGIAFIPSCTIRQHPFTSATGSREAESALGKVIRYY
ncbi:MAG TPA: hypothetical protein VJB12_00350 [Candidatus Nanoarchaeia archaeon]|nr:hypothetical protein [Candidatus Nanoarchaeia archaeon]